MTGKDAPGKTIGSTDTMLDIIEGLKRLDGAGVTELANETDTSKGTVYAHLNTLRQRGYVQKKGETYYVGVRFLSLGEYARTRREIDLLMREKVRALAEETGELAQFVVEENGQGVHTFRKVGEQAFDLLDTSVGRVGYLHQGSAGKAILAHLPEDRIDDIVDRHGLPSRTENTITDRATLDEELAAIRERGYAFNDGELVDGLRAVGAPLVTEDGAVLGGISLAGPEQRLKSDVFRETFPDLLLATVNEVELQLSHSSSLASPPHDPQV
jgi:IclR family acetate operon transcriptional repressor